MAIEEIETRKDIAQVAVEEGLDHVGRIASIIVGAARDVTRELGDWATDMFEMRDAARRARGDRGGPHPGDSQLPLPGRQYGPKQGDTHDQRRSAR